MRTPISFVAVALLLPSLAAAATPQSDSPFSLEGKAAVLGGGFSGQGTRTDSGGLVILDARLVPSFRSGDLELRLPVHLVRDETLGADLSQTIAGATLEPIWRVSRSLKLGAEGGFLKVWRLGWPDQYQPNPDLALQHTDRYSYEAWRAGANVYAQPAKHQHLRLRWRVTSYKYTRDPNWDPVFPTHITPRDNVQNSLDASWRYLRASYALALRLDTTFRRDLVYPARHARTGSIRNPTPTPHQKLNDYEPSVELELRKLADQVKLSLQLGWAIRDDAYEGYYSYSGPHPHAVAEWSATERLTLVGGVEGWWLTYGPSSRDPNRPTPNEGRTRLYDHLAQVKGEVRYRLGHGLSAVAEGHWRGRTTNYPNYVPSVFPSLRLYDIKWDYDNVRAVAGVEWRT